MTVLALMVGFVTLAGHNVWTPMGLEGIRIDSIAVDPRLPGALYAAGDGLYKTTDGGMTWIELRSGLPDVLYPGFPSIVLDPFEPDTLYVGTDCCGVYKTRDAGNTWNAITEGLPDRMLVQVLAMDPTNSSVLFAGGDGETYKTIDGGAHWFYSGHGLPDIIFAVVTSFAFDPTNSNIIYVSVSGSWHLGGVFKTIDGGANWNETDLGCDFEAVVLDDLNPEKVYAGYCGLHKTTDGAESWTKYEGDWTYGIWSMLFEPKSLGTKYAGGGFGAFRSTDAARTAMETGKSPLARCRRPSTLFLV